MKKTKDVSKTAEQKAILVPQYIVSWKNEFSPTGEEHFDLCGNKLCSFLDPRMARSFTSPEEAQAFIDENATSPEHYCVQILKEAWLRFETEKAKGFPYRKLQQKNKSLSVFFNNHTPEQVLDWTIAVAQLPNGADDISYEAYESWPQLSAVFKHIHGVEEYTTDWGDGPRLWTFSITVGTKSKFKDFQKEWKLMMKYKPTLKTEKGDLVVRIFDHFLSEHGNTANLVCHKDGTYTVEEHYFFGGREGAGRISLEEAFNYIQQKRWYD